jgi:hypothetical protein
MTKIYKIVSDEKYELCHPSNQDDFERINLTINGTSCGDTWVPITMDLIREDEGKMLLESDSPWLGSHAPIFSPRAIKTLSNLLQRNGELLSLDCSAELYLFNCTLVLDALDEEKSKIIRFSDGRIMMINQFEFRSSVVKDIAIFKIPNLRVSPVFVSQGFVDLWKRERLTGLDFKLVWKET